MNADQKEKLGLLKDRIDNLSHALLLNLPPSFHVKQIKEVLPELSKELENLYNEEESA